MSMKFKRLVVLRFKDILEFATLYLALFSIDGILLMAQRGPIGSGLIRIFIEELSKYRLTVLLLFSLLIALKHAQIVQAGRSEFKARLVSGASSNEVPAIHLVWSLSLATVTFLIVYFSFTVAGSLEYSSSVAWILAMSYALLASLTMRIKYV